VTVVVGGGEEYEDLLRDVNSVVTSGSHSNSSSSSSNTMGAEDSIKKSGDLWNQYFLDPYNLLVGLIKKQHHFFHSTVEHCDLLRCCKQRNRQIMKLKERGRENSKVS